MPHDQEITHIVVACDESGAKADADRDEAYPGEVGVFAGILAPSDVVSRIQGEFDAAIQEYAQGDGKLHITDLTPEQQHSLRETLFEIIHKHQLPCFWEAIHVAGFHHAFKNLKALVDQAKTQRRSPIKISGNGPKPSSLHVALFEGLYSKVLAFCIERDRHRLHLEIRTDRVDQSIAKMFQNASEALLDFGVHVTRVTGFDTKTKEVVEGKITIQEVPEAERLPITIEHLEIKIVDDSDGLVVAADVLANSLYHAFKTRSNEEMYTALNTPHAVSAHPLAKSLDSFQNWGGYNFTDLFYRHPKARIKSD